MPLSSREPQSGNNSAEGVTLKKRCVYDAPLFCVFRICGGVAFSAWTERDSVRKPIWMRAKWRFAKINGTTGLRRCGKRIELSVRYLEPALTVCPPRLNFCPGKKGAVTMLRTGKTAGGYGVCRRSVPGAYRCRILRLPCRARVFTMVFASAIHQSEAGQYGRGMRTVRFTTR